MEVREVKRLIHDVSFTVNINTVKHYRSEPAMAPRIDEL